MANKDTTQRKVAILVMESLSWFVLPNDQVKPHGQAARTTTDDQRSRKPSHAENPPLVRVGLNRLLARFRSELAFDLLYIGDLPMTEGDIPPRERDSG